MRRDRDEDDDPQPRRRKRTDGDAYEDRSRQPRGYGDDDRPRRRKRDVDDDNEDPPRGREKAGLHPGVIAGIIGGAVGFLVLVAVVIWAIAGRGGSSGDSDIDQALAHLNDPDPQIRRSAAERLGNMQPNDQQRATVARTLDGLVADPNVFTRRAVARALGLWATPNEVPGLIRYLDDQDVFTRQEALKYVGKFRDERALGPVVRCLQDVHCRGVAERTLRDMGPMVEKELLPLVSREEEDVFTRRAAIQVLQDVGSLQCLPVLEAVWASNNVHSSTHLKGPARSAIDSIKARGK
jgi:hypothetical protein